MEAVYKILYNKYKVTMKRFYHIRCDPNLDKGFCAMQKIPCACTGYAEQLSKHWLPNLDTTLQLRYAIKSKTCKYSSILHDYNKWYICQIDLKKTDKMEIKDELVLQGMTWEASYEIE